MKRHLQLLILIIFLLSNSQLLICQRQGQARIDSLISELEKHKIDDTTKVYLYNDIAFELNTSNPAKGIEYALKGISIAEKIHFEKGIARCYNSIGVCYWAESDYPNALEYYFKSMNINEKIDNKGGLASNLTNIGLMYQFQSDFSKALEYLNKSVDLNKEIKNIGGLASNYGLIGNVYNEKEDNAKALEYYFKAYKINKELGLKNGLATNLVNIGKIYQKQNDYLKALDFFFQSLEINKELKRQRGIMYNIGYIGEIYLLLATGRAITDDRQNILDVKPNKTAYLNKSIDFSLKAVNISKEISAKKELSDWFLNISKAYRELNNWNKAYNYADSSYKLRDSVFNQENKIKLANLETRREKEIIEKESEARKKQTMIIIWVSVIGLLSSILFTLFIIQERKKSEKLILNILPSEIERRLKKKEKYIADHYDEASVVFVDISHFTQLFRNSKPEKIVEVLNNIYTEFDHIASVFGLEKIKTIGDCYMAAAGIPVARNDHAESAVSFALEVLNKMNGYETDDGLKINFKIGIDCGTVVAGIIGEKKFIYDIWGVTVNTASRMEQYSEPGKIQCTERFKKKLEISNEKLGINFEERGEIEIKGIGMMNTWFVSR